MLGAIYCEVSCSFCVFMRIILGRDTLFLSVKIDCTIDKYLCTVKLKLYAIMGLLDFLLFGAFMNSLKNNQNSNNHSDYSDRSYSQGYEDGYSDGYIDHDDYQCNDDYDCSDGDDCDDFFDF